MRLTFASISSPQSLGYSLDSKPEYYSRKPDYWVSRSLEQFATYGDGMIQHSPAELVTAEQFQDACLSLAVFIQEHHQEFDEKTCSDIAWMFPTIRAELLQFLGKIKYDATKRQWFTIQDGFKVSKSDKCRHDKRYMEVPDWADGSRKNVAGLYVYCHEFDSGIWQRIAVFVECWQVAWSDGTSLHELVPGLGEQSDDAYRCLRTALDMIESRYNLGLQIKCARHNIQNTTERSQVKQPEAA